MQPQLGRLRYALTNVLLCLILGGALGGVLSIAQARGWIGPWAWLRVAGMVQRHVPALEIRRAILLRLRPLSAIPKPEDLVANACAYWEAKVPEQAVNLLVDVEDVSLRTLAVQSLVEKFLFLDPAFAAELVMTIPDESKAYPLLCSVMARWTLVDAEAALGFYEALPRQKLKPALFRFPLTGLLQLRAERLHLFLLPMEPSLRESLLADLLQAAVDDKTPALSLPNALELFDLMQEDASALQDTARRLSNQVALSDPKREEAWIARQNHGAARDALVAGYLDSVGFMDRLGALHWASSITDNSPLKATAYAEHISAWLAEDRAAAVTWLSSAEGLELCPLDKRALWFAGWSIPAFVTSPSPSP